MVQELLPVLRIVFLLGPFVLGLAVCGSPRRGIVTDATGTPVSGTAVRLLSVDDTGSELSQLEATTTDTEGHFAFVTSLEGNASLVLQADLPTGTLRGFAAGARRSIPVNPLVEGLVDLVIDITETSGGRSVTDFTTQELREIADDLLDADASAIDQTDATAVKAFLRTAIGREIAEASGGTASGRTTQALEGSPAVDAASFTQNTAICLINAEFHLLESDSFRFDVERDGTVCGGTSATLSNMLSEGAFQLYFPDEEFFAGGKDFPSDGVVEREDARELVMGTFALKDPSVSLPDPPEEDDLEVGRKVYVPASGDYIRYLEIFENTGSTDRTLTVRVRSLLETGSESSLLTNDRSPESPDTDDRYLVAYDTDQDRPTVGFIFQDGLGTLDPNQVNAPGSAGGQANEVSYFWGPFTVPAGSKRTLVHFGYLSGERTAELLETEMEGLLEQPDMSGLNLEELEGLLNFTPTEGTIEGEAGAVIGQVTVTGENTRTGETLTITARNDGSFALPLDTVSGDEITLTASDGLNDSVTVP